MYYFWIQNNVIDGKSDLYQQKVWTENRFQVEVSQEVYNNSEKYIWDGENVVLNPNYDAEQLAKEKIEKYAENDEKASLKRYNQNFTVTLQNKECVFDTNEKTQADLLTAFAICSTGATYDGWVCNNGVEIDLTLDDLMIIQAEFKSLSNVYPKWNDYKTQIDNAQTLEELRAIVIDYDE